MPLEAVMFRPQTNSPPSHLKPSMPISFNRYARLLIHQFVAAELVKSGMTALPYQPPLLR